MKNVILVLVVLCLVVLCCEAQNLQWSNCTSCITGESKKKPCQLLLIINLLSYFIVAFLFCDR